MKIDKRKASHWFYLLLFGFNVLVAKALRRWMRRPSKPLVLLYGHKLNGNLLAIYRAHRAMAGSEIQLVFLTMDPVYHHSLIRQGHESCCVLHPSSIRLMANASAIVSDHGLHVMEFLLGSRGLRFFDVWHGIPFKGFCAEDFRIQRQYDETWVASELHRRLYISRFGFADDRVIVTGYARTDQLVSHSHSQAADSQRESLGIPNGRKTILFAPTWAQDDKGRNIFPFGASEGDFLGAMSVFADAHNAVILLRSHLNTGEAATATYPHVIALPGSLYPDAEAILLVSDMLICDWSSIAFDYLLLDRPTLFLDVPAPFRRGFSLGPEYRYGALVRDMNDLMEQLREALLNPADYWKVHGPRHRAIKQEIYENQADGRAAQRCVMRLITAIRESSR